MIEHWRIQQHQPLLAEYPLETLPEHEVIEEEGVMLKVLLDEILASLAPQDRQLIIMRFSEEYTLEEILTMRRELTRATLCARLEQLKQLLREAMRARAVHR